MATTKEISLCKVEAQEAPLSHLDPYSLRRTVRGAKAPNQSLEGIHSTLTQSAAMASCKSYDGLPTTIICRGPMVRKFLE